MMVAIIKVLCLCFATASAETIQGVVRTVWVAPRIGAKRAKQISLVSGLLLSLALCYLFIPWIGVSSLAGLLLVGVALSLFMAAFDIVLARLIIKQKWSIILADFNPTKGNYLLVGLIIMVFLPYLALKLHAGITD